MTRDQYLARVAPPARTLADVTDADAADHARVVAALRRRGGAIGRRDLVRSTKLTAAVIDLAVAALGEAGLLAVETVATEGRPATFYRLQQ